MGFLNTQNMRGSEDVIMSNTWWTPNTFPVSDDALNVDLSLPLPVEEDVPLNLAPLEIKPTTLSLPQTSSLLYAPTTIKTEAGFSPKKEHKDEKRLQRNRKSAAASRARKKKYKQELEERLELLEKKNREAKLAYIRKEAQNAILKQQLEAQLKMVRSSPQLALLFERANGLSKLNNNLEQTKDMQAAASAYMITLLTTFSRYIQMSAATALNLAHSTQQHT